MTRLRCIAPRLGSAPPRIAPIATAGTGFARDDGKTSTQRGYGADWQKVRAEVLHAEPTCRLCRTEGHSRPATDVDHIVSFRGIADPLRLARSNLRPLCRPHHMARTARQAHGQG